MKQKIIGLSQRYLAELRKYLKQGPRASLAPALNVGQRAVTFQLETLEMARMHERALATLELFHSPAQLKRAEVFFTEAITPIVEQHRAAQQSRARLVRMKEQLDQRTQELAATSRQLQRSVVRRKVVEEAFDKSGKHHQKCLQEALQLQKRLRQLTHRVLATQEDERKSISRELQDEIAQTLLGINVRLLSLKATARSNTKGFKNEIASTERLVAKSIRSVRRVAREFSNA